MGRNFPMDDEFQRDLTPDPNAGLNAGSDRTDTQDETPTAYERKEVHRHLADFQDDELKQIPILPQGTRLKQGATYLDLNDPNRQPFAARGDMEVGPDNWYVPKSEVDYQLWNRLTNVQNPERTGETDD